MTFRPLTTITPLQSALLWITVIGVSNHVLIMPILLDAAGRDAWIGALLAFPLMLLWCGLLWFIMGKINDSLVPWIKKKTNTAIAIGAALIYTVYYLVMTSFDVQDTLQWTKTAYLPQTPIWFTSACLIGFAYITAKKGIVTIAITNGILLPFIIVFGLYVMTVNFQVKDYHYLLPIGTHSFSDICMAALFTAAGISGMIFIVFVSDDLKGKLKKRHYAISLLILIELTIGPLIGAIATFGPTEAASMSFPAFEQWRIASVGNEIAQTDFLSIYQWLAGIFIRLSLALYIFQKLWGQKSLPYLALLIYFSSCIGRFNINLEKTSALIYLSALVLNMAFTIFLFILCQIKKKEVN
ncbi:GerAB/ArcD/ProY family transporter [Paenibacillus sp. GCM10027629]|uniref:GerAB/ArcD/ProY family transporter n=1 Tax=Paenibacillus sp. GCM10027629 TaxID=3273414 RepID=UPI00363D3D5E